MLFGFVDSFVDFLLIVVSQLVFVLGLHLLGLVDSVFQVVFGFNGFTLLLVFFGVGLGFLSSFFDFVFAQAAAVLDSDALLLTSAFVFCRNINDTVGVNIESYFNLRHAAGRRRDAVEHKLAERFVVGRHFALTLQDI